MVHVVVTLQLDLPLTGAAGVECRSAGSGDSHQIIYTFERDVVSPGTASLNAGSATIAQPTIGPDSNQVTVNLSAVPNLQQLIVILNNVTDSQGATMSNLPARIDFLLGDTTGNRSVNSSDISQTKSNSGIGVAAANFRTDVTINGAINSSDISLVKSKSGTGLPAAP
ncbi:MAG: hypothetical protein M3Q89_12915 [Verrucomicrobiota bacterium]|nr:hypothetical protein [Verrucomicrobiota bacterium]